MTIFASKRDHYNRQLNAAEKVVLQSGIIIFIFLSSNWTNHDWRQGNFLMTHSLTFGYLCKSMLCSSFNLICSHSPPDCLIHGPDCSCLAERSCQYFVLSLLKPCPCCKWMLALSLLPLTIMSLKHVLSLR